MYADLLAEAMWRSVGLDRYWQLSPAAAQCLIECDCTTENRVAMWCAQTGHESCGLLYMEEIADGSAYEGREDLGNIYPGDGCKFKGRGPIMVTGRDNYTRCSEWAFSQGLVPSPTFFVDFPEEMAGDSYGFTGTTWYWTTQRPMNDAADAGDIDLATYYINGGYNGLEDRTNRWNYCLGMGQRIMGLTDQNAANAGPQLVGERVLSYDHNIVPQETGYWCGPASAQVALNCRGIFVPESTLAQEMGTDQDGTDYVALIELSLDPRLPEANYTSHDAPHDPPYQSEKDAFWDALKRTIDNGYALIMNWVAPPGNYPVGIKGSPNPSYGGGTVFHYVTAAGYDDNPAQRAVWIADSGFQPFGYWMSFDQCCTLIPPKAFCYANLPHVGGVEEPVSDTDIWIYEQLCGPIDPNTGYGSGWTHLGQNQHGQNLYVVDALGQAVAKVSGTRAPALKSHPTAKPKAPLDYAALSLDQLAGPVTADGQRHGWPVLGNRSLTDAVDFINDTLGATLPPVGPPPEGGPPKGRPAILTFAGTWAAPGVGFPSDVARACTDVADEIPVQGPNSFGPIPPGAIDSPSYKESVDISVNWAVDWVLNNTDRPVIAGGYSQGGEAASRFRMEFEPGGRLEHLRANWVCGYVFGNPCRHLERTYFGGPPTPYDGIAVLRLPQLDWDWCELIDPGDLYGTCARGLAGEIQRDVYTMCTEMEMHSGFAEFCQTLVANMIEVAKNLDGDAYDDLKEHAESYVDLDGAQILPPERFQPLTDRLVAVSGIAAAIAAAIDALIFFCTSPPTAAHIEYHIREAWPGTTYVALAIQHVHDWVKTYAA